MNSDWARSTAFMFEHIADQIEHAADETTDSVTETELRELALIVRKMADSWRPEDE